MKKNILKVVTVFCFIFALFFVSCTQVHRDITPTEFLNSTNSGEVILEIENWVRMSFEDIGITSENAGDYYLKFTYELKDPEKANFSPVQICDWDWNSLIEIERRGPFDSGILNIEINEIIAKTDRFRVNWWGYEFNDLIKCEIVKKYTDSEQVILEFENHDRIFFENIGITSENARDYYLKITYELIEGYKGWGPGKIWYGNWEEQGIALNGLNESGIDLINISEIIGNRNSFFVQYWANAYGNNWVNNVKF